MCTVLFDDDNEDTHVVQDSVPRHVPGQERFSLPVLWHEETGGCARAPGTDDGGEIYCVCFEY
eukprot:1634906-Pyramimonas_sp.AAC.2